MTLGEGLLTHRAPVGSVPVVGPHVDRQVGLASTRFPTGPTHKRLVARVDPHVIVQVDLTLEGPAAVGRLAGVDPGVDPQPAPGAEALPTVAPQVDLQLLAGQEHLAEGRPLLLRVDLLVLPQRPRKTRPHAGCCCESTGHPSSQDISGGWSHRPPAGPGGGGTPRGRPAEVDAGLRTET